MNGIRFNPTDFILMQIELRLESIFRRKSHYKHIARPWKGNFRLNCSLWDKRQLGWVESKEGGLLMTKHQELGRGCPSLGRQRPSKFAPRFYFRHFFFFFWVGLPDGKITRISAQKSPFGVPAPSKISPLFWISRTFLHYFRSVPFSSYVASTYLTWFSLYAARCYLTSFSLY